MEKLSSFVGKHTSCMTTLAEEAVAKVQQTQEDISTRIIPVKDICKDLDKRLHELVDYPGRKEMVEALKMLNSAIKDLDGLAGAVPSVGPETVAGTTFSKVRQDAMAVRQSARLQVCCRSAAMILSQGSVEDIPQLYAEARTLKVVFPGQLKAKLVAGKPLPA